MKTVAIAFAVSPDHGKQIVGVAEDINGAVNLIKKSGYTLTSEQIALLGILGYTTNLPINFKIETWQVHQ